MLMLLEVDVSDVVSEISVRNSSYILRCFCLTVCLSVCLVHRAYSRTEKPRKTKIGTEVVHVTRDSETTFKVKRSKVNLLLMS